MDTLTLLWIVSVVGALVAGVCLVGVLVVRQQVEAIAALLGISGFGFSAYAVVLISEAYARLDATLYAFAFMVGGIVGGWAVASSLLDRFVRVPEPLALDDIPAVDLGTAVIVVSCMEPARYDPPTTANMLQSLAEEDLLEPSMGVLPFLFFAQKARYRAVGGTSPAAAELRQLTERIERALLDLGVGRVGLATCSGEHRLASEIKAAVDAGYRTIIVAEATVGESLHLAGAKRESDALRLDAVGARLVFTGALHSSEKIVEMLVARAMGSADSGLNTGVVLVGHGQPEGLARRNQTFDEQETAFLSRIRMRLVEEGISEALVRVAWAEWSAPDVTSAVRHLAALGCRRVVVIPAVFPFETIATRLDLDLAVRQARVDESVAVITLSAWRDDDAVVSEIVERVRAEL